ncbi:molybdopterin-dependent oxidoreductase [Iamia sp.]|uniref:molybdopterin-dependent oxidoreductase n=1 Tax=Iamia sp. TaxID=2722710 RepID=UPI002B65153D|nr:molybdopterin-dependent oxidoreductase [Iamia sp.]HXH58550.1 molybdopterin-dependent oxidoreductase [Iamia sp.]
MRTVGAPGREGHQPAPARAGSARARMTARQVDVVLEVLLLAALATGLAAWTVGTGWVRWLTVAHGVCGLTVLVLSGAKLRGSVHTGLRRGRATRWISIGFGVGILVTIALGVAHATALWFGVGEWTALWTHVLVAVVLVPVLAWHVGSRPSRPRLADLDRRAALRGGAALAIGAAAYAAQEVVVRGTAQPGGERRATGSHDVGSFDPDQMPAVSWLNDTAPSAVDDDWPLVIGGRPVTIAELRAATRPVTATVDCTGGWSSTQRWDAVPLAELLEDGRARSIRVTSFTGYSRLLPYSDRAHLHLAVGYGGEPLRRGHGEPVRLVAPGRRGPWWVKWVVAVELDDRPWWLQLPLPLE